ncbi:hypothetical protein FOCC_FOCC008682 [Frankliniella occidentalis]|nr:hypothetical protein FOCC_FOCC008682 [Frankliniella occidentalis]
MGSSAYPNFCAFGQYVDNLLGELGGERLLKMECGDEMCGQEQAFRKWAPEVFSVACETFCLDDDDSFLEATMAFKSESISPSSIRFVDAEPQEIDQGLSRCHNRRVRACMLRRRSNLHGSNASRATLQLELDAGDVEYQPGDHVGVFAINRTELVDGIIAHLQQPCDPDKSWEPHPRLPRVSLRMLLARFLDLTTPPTPQLLQWLATQATDPEEQRGLTILATESGAYEDWRHWRFPHLLEVLEEFPSVRPPAALLCAQLTPLQPRFYSISSSPLVHRDQVHLTVAVVTYRTKGGEGPEHFGVCSTYLQHAPVEENVAPNFHLPTDISRPIIMVGPGTGVAPFRGFWHHRKAQLSGKGRQSCDRCDYPVRRVFVVPMAIFDPTFSTRSWDGGWRIICSESARFQRTDHAEASRKREHIILVPTGKQEYRVKPLEERTLDLAVPVSKKSFSVEDLVQFYERSDAAVGSMWLFFGCRQRALDLYKDEKAAMLRDGVLDQTYVQDLVRRESGAVYRKLVLEGGHFFVCGDCTMAEHVYQTLKLIIQERGAMTDSQVERYMLKLRDENRYHEDIFGITLRTAEVHNRSRESARSRMASQSQ